MPSIILWIYCVFFGSLGVFTQSTSAVTYIKMNATSHDTCQVTDAENVTRYNWTFTVGDAIKLSFSNRLYINEVSCSYLHEHPILEDRNVYLGIRRESKIFIAYKNMSAVWKCRMLTNRSVKGLDDATIRTENGTFVETVCEFNLIVKVACPECSTVCHHACVNLPAGAQVPPTWRCPECTARGPRDNTDSTPVRRFSAAPPVMRALEEDTTAFDTTLEMRESDASLQMRAFLDEVRQARQECRAWTQEMSELRTIVASMDDRLTKLEGKVTAIEQQVAQVEPQAESKKAIKALG